MVWMISAIFLQNFTQNLRKQISNTYHNNDNHKISLSSYPDDFNAMLFEKAHRAELKLRLHDDRSAIIGYVLY